MGAEMPKALTSLSKLDGAVKRVRVWKEVGVGQGLVNGCSREDVHRLIDKIGPFARGMLWSRFWRLALGLGGFV